MSKPQTKATKSKYPEAKLVRVVLPVECRCYVCGKTIREGGDAIYRWDKGNRHPDCEAPDGR